jgi:long-chain acyl-CoA synthetase
LVYKKFRTRLGGRVRFCVSGGAPLAKDVGEFFADLGVTILEGYGLSETSPVITVNREKKNRYGTVGLALPGIEVKIADDGEIITKSPCVMLGYFGKPAETAQVVKDGWFYTGDLGTIDKDGFLAITGRKKELIVTSGGKKVVPKAIEEKMESDPYILRCVLFGEGKKCISALIVPEKESLIEYAKQQKISFRDYAELLRSPKIYSFIEGRIEALSGELAGFEKIKFFVLLENDFTQEGGELTPTLKVKRNVVFSRYKDLLLPLYEKEISH